MLREPKLYLQCLCINAMGIIYEKYFNEIGPFVESDYIIELMDTTRNRALRDRLLGLMNSLCFNPMNIEKILSKKSVEVLIAILAMSHTQPKETVVIAGLLTNSLIARFVENSESN
jgi:DnaJ family protein C protein 13